MEIAKIRVNGLHAVTVESKGIPKGIIGATVSIEYTDPMWDSLSKTVVFRSCTTKDVLNAGSVVEIPPEVVAQHGYILKIGVYGVDAENNVTIPTTWADLGCVRDAADPAGDESADPHLPVWAQVQGDIESLCENDIPKVFFGAALPQTKDDTVMSFRYISKTEDISGYCKTKAQGNSSMSFPKKNQTVKLYKDAGCTEKLKVGFKGWGKQNKFCFKANWVDLTHARNIVSARLWGDVVKSRANYMAIPELLRTSPNQGAVDGFPVKVYANGIYQGRYTINIPKDAWMANMDDELDTHCILCGENYVSGCFRAEAAIDGSDWTDEVHDTVPDAIKTRWNEAINFVMSSTDEEFVAGIASYFDLESLIDYYIFGVVVCNMDGFGKNQLYHTYDGQKWFATVYDMDSTFGTYFSSILSYNYARSSYEDYKNGGGNLLYIRLESLFTERIKSRYAELKKGALSLTNIINRFERFTDIAPPYLVEEDYAETTMEGAFTAIPLQGQSNIQQIRDYIVNRYSYVDSYIGNLGVDATLLYSLPVETTFDGTADQLITTDVKLFDEAKDFTIIVDATNDDENYAPNTCLFQNYRDGGYKGGVGLSTNYPWAGAGDQGFKVKGVSSNGAESVFGVVNTTERAKMAIVFNAGLPSSLYYRTESADAIVTQAPGSYTAVQHNGSLTIGAWDNKSEAYVGTIHSLEIYNKAMSAEEIAKKLVFKKTNLLDGVAFSYGYINYLTGNTVDRTEVTFGVYEADYIPVEAGKTYKVNVENAVVNTDSPMRVGIKYYTEDRTYTGEYVEDTNAFTPYTFTVPSDISATRLRLNFMAGHSDSVTVDWSNAVYTLEEVVG